MSVVGVLSCPAVMSKFVNVNIAKCFSAICKRYSSSKAIYQNDQKIHLGCFD